MATEKIFQEALALPPEDRDRLASALLQSLYPDAVETISRDEWEQAWSTEIDRRLRDLDDGRVTAISYDEFKRRVRARLSRP